MVTRPVAVPGSDPIREIGSIRSAHPDRFGTIARDPGHLMLGSGLDDAAKQFCRYRHIVDDGDSH